MEFKTEDGQVNAEDEVDQLFKDRPIELKKIKDNQKFIKEIEDKPLLHKVASIPVFGTSVDFNAILKDNIWNRSAYTVDMLCDMFLHMNIERMKKYQAKKRKLPTNILFLLLILVFVGVGLIVLILFLQGGGLGDII
ncbi:unnamed protein product [marine sediment metagenome]|uniref:Uncharacterized protein n=1 Tax=marine sediment metagenome TaxID=412755 RepID=X0XZH6_9ZZZZ